MSGKTKIRRSRYPYNKPLRDACMHPPIARALSVVHDLLGDRQWLLGGGHATSCYTESRVATEVVVLVPTPVILPAQIDVGLAFPFVTRVVVLVADFEAVYRRSTPHTVMGREYRIPAKDDLQRILDAGTWRDWGDAARLKARDQINRE